MISVHCTIVYLLALSLSFSFEFEWILSESFQLITDVISLNSLSPSLAPNGIIIPFNSHYKTVGGLPPLAYLPVSKFFTHGFIDLLD